MKGQSSETAVRLTLELKYCERCGGLWLHPTGGGQIYCVGCARKIAELPPASHEPDTVWAPRGSQRVAEGRTFDAYGEDDDRELDAAGGAA